MAPLPYFNQILKDGGPTMNSSSMMSDLTFDERPEYLHARISAKNLNRETVLDYLSEISLKCASVRCKQMLLERDIAIGSQDKDIFASIKELVEMSAGVRIALVNPHVTVEDAMKFLDEFQNRDDFRYFNDIADAQGWLLETSH